MNTAKNTAQSLTENEVAYLLAILNSEHNAEGISLDAIGYGVWAWSPAEEFGTSAGGIAASLNKKGLAISTPDSGHGEDDGCIEITQAGWDALVAKGLINA